MPIRNPFARRPGLTIPTDENVRPGSAVSNTDVAHPGFERVDTIGSKASSAVSVRSSRSQDTGEYKMSGKAPPRHKLTASQLTTTKVVNDSGVYLPPSPVEKEATWPRRYLSRNSTDTKSSVGGGEIEHFSISRESFDSYRRSFVCLHRSRTFPLNPYHLHVSLPDKNTQTNKPQDISARSPIVTTDAAAPRQSLDSRFPRLPYHRSSLAERRPAVPTTAEESNFEDVGLNDENNKPQNQPKKRSFFKFGSDENEAPLNAIQGQTQHAGIASRLLGGRKRGQSGQGAELGVMPLGERPKTASTLVETEVSS
jgi:hypothetical protein